MNDRKLKLFSSCIITKGASRSTIVDTSSGEIHIIPNSLFDVLNYYDGKKIAEIYENRSEEEQTILNEYFTFLEDNNLIFYTDFPQNFPAIKKEIYFSSIIENMIIEVEEYSALNKNDVAQINNLIVKHIQIYFRNCTDYSALENLLLLFDESCIRSIELFVNFTKDISIDRILDLLKKFNRVLCIIVYGHQHDTEIDTGNHLRKIILTTKKSIDNKACGIVGPDIFNHNLNHVIESYNHNTCLNRKLTIDASGNIKSCPSMQKKFGNINSISLVEVANNPEFQKYWNLNKDVIAKCKDCEFRRVCTDCRAYTDDPDDIFSGPLKCGYDPFNHSWSKWSKHPLKQKSIEYYNMQELVKTNV